MTSLNNFPTVKTLIVYGAQIALIMIILVFQNRENMFVQETGIREKRAR